MMSPGGSIVASLKNVNGFLAVNIPPDDLIRIDFEQEGVVPKVMLHIFEEFVLFLGRHPFNNEVPHMDENPSEQSRLGIFFSKEIFEGGVIHIHNAFVHDEIRPEFFEGVHHGKHFFFCHGVMRFRLGHCFARLVYRPKMLFLTLPEDHTYGKVACITHKLKREEERGIFLKKMGHRPGYLQKVLYESSLQTDMIKKATDTLDGSGI
nr:hypothetical protein [Tanacetum cinerariifolium]